MIPKIVAPAGNLQKLKIACLYGADAVYAGGADFNLRLGSDNFSFDELKEGVLFAHEHKVSVYYLLNSHLFDDEIKRLPSIIESASDAGVDSFLASDAGVVEMIRRYSKIPVYLSTQSSCLNVETAKVWKKMGIQRIVLGREVSIEEAGRIKKSAGVEVEMFVHGAMCMGFSGHCLLSNFFQGRDANRGACCQACRFRYDLFYEKNAFRDFSFLNSKDLNGMGSLSQFVHHEIDALKIEGRMKSPLYVATLVKAYREALDSLQQGKLIASEDCFKETDRIRHRPYTEGFLKDTGNLETIYYQKSREFEPYEFTGIVLEVLSSEEKLVVWIANPFCSGDELEVLPFKGQAISLDLKTVRDPLGNRIEKARPNTVLCLDYLKGVEPLNVLRRKKDQACR